MSLYFSGEGKKLRCTLTTVPKPSYSAGVVYT